MKDYLNEEDKLLLKEAGLSSTCIGQGITILRKANFVAKWNYYQSFFLLTIGIERLLKLITIAQYRSENNGNFPKNSYLKLKGHDIKKLITKIEGYEPAFNDNVFITDEIQLDIIEFLTSFAKSSRYYNLDALSGVVEKNDPLIEWKKIQNKIIIKEGLKSKPLPKKLTDSINSFAKFSFHNEEGDLISNAEQFYQDSSILDKLQGLSVYYIWKIIQIFADKLRFLEFKYHLHPLLQEFYPYFIKDWDKYNNVIRRKDWNYLK
jgi:hypothetical protein